MVAREIKPKEELWGHCAIGYFLGRFPGKEAI